MSIGTEKRRKERAKRKAAKRARMKASGGLSVYARKLKGDYPSNSPYRDQWSEFKPDGGRMSRKINQKFRIT